MRVESFDKEAFKKEISDNMRDLYGLKVEKATPQQLFQAVAYSIRDDIMERWMSTQEICRKKNLKTVYYMSMEFLMGRALGNNLLGLGIMDGVKECLDELGFDINAIEDEEPDPALGNGGLGRLAACFLDSLATLGYPACGCGIRYRYGMFKQKIEDGYQVEVPDNWLKNGYPFEIRRSEEAVEVRFGGSVEPVYDEKEGRMHYEQRGCNAVRAVPYDMPIVGFGNGIVDTLCIWDAEAIEDFSLGAFDAGDYDKAVENAYIAENLVNVLYPNDSHMAGKALRLKQQYFFISASVQRAVARFKELNDDIYEFPQKVAFQLNDTHPTVAVAELMRILIDVERLEWEDAWDITRRTCAYTNHTIMSEALEKWPIDLFKSLLPRIYQIIEEIDRRFKLEIEAKYPGNEYKVRMMAILYDGQVRMAHMAIAGSHSVNGVAALHTEILKKQELRDFYEMMPKKFSNKTNGITQRRFLLHANPLLADWVTEKVGDGWITDLGAIDALKKYADDKRARSEFMDIRKKNKERLAAYILKHNGIEVNTDSIFDIQVKRLHEYKRQLLNILHVMYLYNRLKKNPDMDMYPRTFIFGAKAAAAYHRAKLTIKLINAVADVINNDEFIGGKLKVVFIEDYKVSNAELLFSSADVSEQISTASKEASGTGNMKFMLNGAVTIGAMDGANVEIVEEVGQENAFIFGLSADEVISYENNGGYNPKAIADSDAEINEVLNQLISGAYAPEDPERFREIYDSLINGNDAERADRYFILADFRSYAQAHERVEMAYRDRDAWARMSILNTASCGKFSADRTIEEYVDDIWHLEKITQQVL